MHGIRLILALHNHQPVGNFDGVFESAYRDSYEPFLGVMEDYPDVSFVLHTSGPLLEWLAEKKPEYIGRVRALVEEGRVEILGGGFFEPILTMLPRRDRVGQIRSYAEYLSELFGTPMRGMWVPERVWEAGLVSDLVDAGVEYTVLDDYHFHRAGVTDDKLIGYYLTEDDGKLLKVFPNSERLRYMVPFHEPHASYEFLRKLADEHPSATVVCADDGEKFGSWPDTFDHVFTRRWLRNFCEMLRGNRDWLRSTTFAEAVDSTLPTGKIYIPDGSYREMTEWALPPDQFSTLKDALKQVEGHPAAERLRPFVRAAVFGGTSRRAIRKVMRCTAGCSAFPTASPLLRTPRPPIRTFSKPRGANSIAASATAPIGTARSAGFICRTCATRCTVTSSPRTRRSTRPKARPNRAWSWKSPTSISTRGKK